MSTKIDNLVFDAALKGATEAANKAGDEWMAAATARGPLYAVKQGDQVVGTLLDVCGFAHLKANDKRNKFYKWGKKNCGWQWGFVGIGHKYRMRQELGLAEACLRAANEYLRKIGIDGLRVESRID